MTDQENKAIDAIVAEEMQMPPDRVQLSQPAVFISPTHLAYMRACEEEVEAWRNLWRVGKGKFEQYAAVATMNASGRHTDAARAAWDAERGTK